MSNVITVVVSTKKIDEKFRREIKKHFTHPKTEILMYENPGEYSLTEIYNKGLNESTSDIVVFTHDDVIFGTKNMGNKILKIFENNPTFGILGIAGTTDMVNGKWWEIRESGAGRVYHSKDGKTWESRYSKDICDITPKEVVVVDGLFMMVNKNKIKKQFDESIKGFHLYDIDFCLSNYMEGVNIGVTTKFKIIHKSIGETNDEWEVNRKIVEEKHKENLPIRMTDNKTFEEKLDIDRSKIGVGMVTYDAPERLKQSAVTIPDWMETFVIVNDGTPYEEEGIYPKHAEVITHEVNKGVGSAKNTALEYLLDKGCEHIFLIEDDILLRNEGVFEEYIKTSVHTGIKHLNYALQGPANRDNLGEPKPLKTIDYPDGTKLDIYPNCVGAFSYYHRTVLETIGLFDEAYNNAWEHVDHTLTAFINGFTTPYWNFADINDSWRFIDDIPNCIEDSKIRKDDTWSANVKTGAAHFRKKHKFIPTQIPMLEPEKVNYVMNTLYNLR